jgi:integrase
MPHSTQHVPTYRHRKSRDLAVVTINGKDIYLGKYNSADSRQRYDRLIQEWLASGRTHTSETPVNVTGYSVAELIVAYLEHAAVIYRKDGKPTSHLHSVEDAVSALKTLYGLEPCKDFGPLKLKAVRQAMVGRGLCRTTVNKYVDNLRRVFKWGTENELVPAAVYHALQAVSGLRKGRSEAKENGPVKPVPEAYINAVRPHLSRQVLAMIDLQLITGMRPGEVVIMRGCDIETTGKLWVYTPERHKTEHHGHLRPVYLGPKAQEVIKPFLRPDLTASLFDPREATDESHAVRRRNRQTPMTPSQAKRARKFKPKTAPQQRYTTESYRRAVARACRKADRRAHRERPEVTAEEILVPQWHPHQLRHNAATRLRKEYGLDAARVVLGHRSAAVTEIYAEIDHTRAQDIMSRVG